MKKRITYWLLALGLTCGAFGLVACGGGDDAKNTSPNVGMKEDEAQLAYTLINNDTEYEVSGIGDYSETEIVIPARYKELPVTSIGSRAFYDVDEITKVTIGENVKTIGESAFYNCNGLTEISMPESVQTIGDYAFYDCSLLSSVALSNGVRTIGANAFYQCYELTSITIPNSVTAIGESAFQVCNKLASVEIGNGVETIGDKAFSNCGMLTNVTIGEGVKTIGEMAFYCTGVDTIVVPDKVENIGNKAFSNCGALTSVTMGQNVKTIGEETFSYCGEMTNIVVPNSIQTVGYRAFYSCNKLQYNTKDGARYLGNAENLYVVLVEVTDKNMMNFTLPQGTRVVYEGAFFNCNALSYIVLNENIVRIEEGAFFGCSALAEMEVYYKGEASMWENISVATGDGSLEGKTIYYYSAEEPTNTTGNYWCYVDNLPKKWVGQR